MTTWQTFATAEPALAAAVRTRFDAHAHKTMATLRADGAPRISGTEVTFLDDDLWIGCMPGSVKAADLRRDPRIALHSGSDEPDVWTGDAKVVGRAVLADEATRATRAEALGAPPGPFDLFRIDLTEVVEVRLGEPRDHLVITSWHPDRGVRSVRRA
jgi:hypothetical protein